MNERITTSGIWAVGRQVLIGKRASGGATGELWEFPGGKNRWGETPQQTLAREFFEELGIDIQVGKQIFSHDFTNRETLYHLMVFMVKADVPKNVPLRFHSEFRWVDINDLSQYPMVPSDESCLKSVIEAVRSQIDDSKA